MRRALSDFNTYKLSLLYFTPSEVNDLVLAGSTCRKARVSLAELVIHQDFDWLSDQPAVLLE
jgi:hypothetical protein